VFIGLLFLIAGCTGFGNRAIDQATLPTLKNKTLSLVIHESPDFLAITPGKKMLTIADIDAGYINGNRLVQKSGINDPAEKICQMLARVLGSNYGLLYHENSMLRSSSKDMKYLMPLANEKDYLLDVETIGWLVENNSFERSGYYLKYVVETRLIDVRKSKPIGHSTCEYDSTVAGKKLVSYAKLIENDAAYIKLTLDEAATFCVNKLKSELFSTAQ